MAQPTPPSPDTTTFYTRYTTVVQPTPDMPTLCTIYTRQAKFLPQNPTSKKTSFTTYVDLGRPNTPTTLCTRYVNIQLINTSLHLLTIYTVTFQAGQVRSFQRSEFLTRQQTNCPKVIASDICHLFVFAVQTLHISNILIRYVYLPAPE